MEGDGEGLWRGEGVERGENCVLASILYLKEYELGMKNSDLKEYSIIYNIFHEDVTINLLTL